MAKSKLTFRNTTSNKVVVAATLADVKLGNGVNVGSDCIVNVDYRNPQQLVDMTQLLATVTGNEKIGGEEPAKEESKSKSTSK